jgi:hypothetical protein
VVVFAGAGVDAAGAGVAGAAAAGAGAGVAVVDDAEDDDEDDDDNVDGASALAAPPDDAYRSLYQPPPLRWNAERDKAFSRVFSAWQLGHAAGAGSECLSRNSSR